MNLQALSNRELLQLSASSIEELRSRGAVRTSNATGDYAEHLFGRAFGWSLQPNSNAGFDAEHAGVRYQVKCRRLTSRNPSRQLGEFPSFEQRKFDVLAAVLFTENYEVHRAALVPFEAVERLSTIVAGRRRFMMRDAVWLQPDVQDVTAQLRDASMDASHNLERNRSRRLRPAGGLG